MVGTLGPGLGYGKAARFTYIATAAQTSFAGADSTGVTMRYTAQYVEVVVNGRWLPPSDYTATDGSTVVLPLGCVAGDIVYVYALSTFTALITNGIISDLQNVGFAVSASAGALTIALKDLSGNDATVNTPITLQFRNATPGNGSPNFQRQITAAASITIPSTSTLGITSSTACRVWITGWDDAGTFRLGVFNASTANQIYSLNDDVASSLQVVAAGNAAGQHYTAGAAVTSKAMRILGYVDWTPSGMTAGTWTTTNLNSIMVFGPGVKRPGDEVQRVRLVSTAGANGSTILPGDNTIPQITEGVEFMAQAITPRNACNILEIEVSAMLMTDTSGRTISYALFQDAIANALTAQGVLLSTGNRVTGPCALKHQMVAQTASSTTFRYRAGPDSADTVRFNQNSSAQNIFGGVANSYLTIRELMG